MQNTINLLKKQINNLSFFILILNIFFIGASLNFIAVINNHGKMPVLFNKYQFEYQKHFSFSNCKEVNYCYFSDIFTLENYHFSIGDFFIILSIVAEIILLTRIWTIKSKLRKI
jgi:hypothetical protein